MEDWKKGQIFKTARGMVKTDR